MKQKIKLRDLTEEQYKVWFDNNCSLKDCVDCPFDRIMCNCRSVGCWSKNKDLYSDKFLDQEIEIEVPDENVHVQILKNDDERLDYIHLLSNYEYVGRMSNDFVRFLKLKNTPFIRVEIFVKTKFICICFFHSSNKGLIDSYRKYDNKQIVDWLRENKI